ncbi:MAG: cache domain-containing protein [Burkholderiales bacterium]|nr:cache domain-containing protein [Burkholderiales bacterium]
MKRYFFTVLLALASLLSTAPASAASDKGSAEEAVALVKKGVAFIKANGTEAAYAAISDTKGQFIDRDLYLFVFDMNGKALAHGANPKLIGKILMDMKDADGKMFVKDFYEVAHKKGRGWVDYKWPHPVTKALEQKSTYIEKLDNDTIIGCGVYK